MLRSLYFVAMVILGAMTLLVVVHVVMRYVFRAPIGIGEELAIVFLFVVVFAAAPELFVRGRHLRVNVIADRFPLKIQHWAEIFSTTVGLLFMGFFTWYTVRLTTIIYKYDVPYLTMVGVPQWPQYALVAAALALVSIFMFIQLLKLLERDKIQTTVAKGQREE